MKKKAVVGTITIDSEENDDWMKSLPGYADEVEIVETAMSKLCSNDVEDIEGAALA